jgi:hypothetical protein
VCARATFQTAVVCARLQGLIDLEQEGVERARLYTELDRMFEIERAELEQCAWEPNPAKGDDDSDDSDDADAAVPIALKAELAALDRKYRNLKRQVCRVVCVCLLVFAVARVQRPRSPRVLLHGGMVSAALSQVGEDPLMFLDHVFSITPAEGTVWPNSSIEITVSFTPDVAAEYACSAFLEVGIPLPLLCLSLILTLEPSEQRTPL